MFIKGKGLKFLIISNTKLKVTLTKKECDEYKLDMTRAEFSSREVRSVIKDIVAKAEMECNFKVDGEKILVQMYPMPDGSGEMFVTKLVNLPWREREAIGESGELTTYEEQYKVYCFLDRELLKRGMEAIKHTCAKCDIYKSDSGEYFVRVKEEKSNGIAGTEILTEFSTPVERIPEHVMFEYGEAVAMGDGIEAILSENVD